MAARLQAVAEADTINLSESTCLLIEDVADCTHIQDITPKGFTRPVGVYRLDALKDAAVPNASMTRKGKHVEVSIVDSAHIREAIEELKRIQEEFEERLRAES
jgi:hypothetical protein